MTQDIQSSNLMDPAEFTASEVERMKLGLEEWTADDLVKLKSKQWWMKIKGDPDD